jgi:hypothetical protein
MYKYEIQTNVKFSQDVYNTLRIRDADNTVDKHHNTVYIPECPIK